MTILAVCLFIAAGIVGGFAAMVNASTRWVEGLAVYSNAGLYYLAAVMYEHRPWYVRVTERVLGQAVELVDDDE